MVMHQEGLHHHQLGTDCTEEGSHLGQQGGGHKEEQEGSEILHGHRQEILSGHLLRCGIFIVQRVEL